MLPGLLSHQLGRIALLPDSGASRERSRNVTQIANALRQIAQVEVLRLDTTEESLVQYLNEQNFHLVLLPLRLYLEWTKVEGGFGIPRTSGPTVAGYFTEPLAPETISLPSLFQRAILLDFCGLEPREVVTLVGSLILDSRRSGLKPLFKSEVPIYCENWYSPQGQYQRAEQILALPEIQEHGWNARANAIRLILHGLWNFVYDEGPGKAQVGQAPVAYLQTAVDSQALVFRLLVPMAGWKAIDALKSFWFDPSHPSRGNGLLHRFADWIRVHWISQAPEIELTIGLFKSAPAEKHPASAHTLWIEPLALSLITEPPYEVPSPQTPNLRVLPNVDSGSPRPRLTDTSAESAKDRILKEAQETISQLRKAIAERDSYIQELRAGGVGTAQPLPPPDVEGILEAFQHKYFEARFQIRQFENKINEAEKRGATPGEIEGLRTNMNVLIEREQGWIRQIADTIKAVKERKAVGGKD